jgi:hypothetical protein
MNMNMKNPDNTFLEFYPTLAGAIQRRDKINAVLEKEVFCVVHGPEDNYAVMSLEDADEGEFIPLDRFGSAMVFPVEEPSKQ